MKYEHLRNQLHCWLHRDYDLDGGTVFDAIVELVRHCDIQKMPSELQELSRQSEEEIERVLGEHDVELWSIVTPRELLTTLQVLSKLRGD